MTQETRTETHDTLLWLLSLSKTLLSTRELDRLLELVAQVFLDATEAERVVVLLREAGGDSPLRTAASLTKSGKLTPVDARISSLAQEIAAGGSPVFTTDTTDKRMDRASVLDLGLQMVVCVPLRGPSGIVGVIYADGRTTFDHVFTTTNKSRLEALADHAGAAIENARYFEGVTRDPETQLVNAAYFRSMVEQNTLQSDGFIAVAHVVDLEGIVAKLGAALATTVLRLLADSVRAHLQRPEFAGRLAKNEFGLCLKGADMAVAKRRLNDWVQANRLLQIEESAQVVSLGLKVGLVPFAPGAAVEALVTSAREVALAGPVL